MRELDILPPIGTRETDAIDFKETTSPTDPVELAKDVAALANTLGGVLIIGAKETDSSVLKGYPGIPMKHAISLEKAYEEAVKDRCVPVPRITFRKLDIENCSNVVLVVHVWPSAVAPIGVSIKKSKEGKQPQANDPALPRLSNESWCFPWRANSLTKYLRPDQFGALQDMNTRQTAALLAGISTEDSIRIRSPRSVHKPGIARPLLHAKFVGVSLAGNVAEFRAGTNANDALLPLRIPLPWIETIWRDAGENSWEIAVKIQINQETVKDPFVLLLP
jgi:hypothetical protein